MNGPYRKNERPSGSPEPIDPIPTMGTTKRAKCGCRKFPWGPGMGPYVDGHHPSCEKTPGLLVALALKK